MPGLRLFILWIVCVCVPLQGHAAAAMALCGPGHGGGGGLRAVMAAGAAGDRTIEAHGALVGHHVPAATPVARMPAAAAAAARDHGAHPCHEGVSHAGAQADADPHVDVEAGTDAHVGADADPVASADAPHTCGACAACHAAALTGRLDPVVLHDLPPADLAEPPLVAATRVPRVLDRPPRG